MTFKALPNPPFTDHQQKFCKHEKMSHSLQISLSRKSPHMLALWILYLGTRRYLNICCLRREGTGTGVYYFKASIPGYKIKTSQAPNQIISHGLSGTRERLSVRHRTRLVGEIWWAKDYHEKWAHGWGKPSTNLQRIPRKGHMFILYSWQKAPCNNSYPCNSPVRKRLLSSLLYWWGLWSSERMSTLL